MLKLNGMQLYTCLINIKLILPLFIFIMISLVSIPEHAFSSTKNNKISINGSGLKIPRIVSLKNSLTYMRSGPGKEFPVKFELNQKGYPLKIIAEFNNWRKVKTYDNLSGWIHTQLLSSFKTGIIIKKTFLKTIPSDSSNSLAKLLPNLLINIKKCKEKWCKVEIIKRKTYVGWIKKEAVWGSLKN